MISKTKISKRMKKKTDKELADALFLAKKENTEIAQLLSLPSKKMIKKNLDEIDKESKENEIIIVPGKVLGRGEISKKIKLIAFKFSLASLKKMDKSKIKATTILEELKKNKKIEGKILR